MTLDEQLRAMIAEEVARQLGKRPANDGYLSVAEAAAVARVSPGTIRRWVRRGELTRHEAGARLLVKRDELEKFLACEVTPIDANLSPEERARRRFG